MRLGFFKHLKLNTESMIKMFEEGEWLSVDLLVDWEEQTVSIYVDGEGVLSTPFFTKRKTTLKDINAVALYGLTPEGTSRFRNLMICDEICSGCKLQIFIKSLMNFRGTDRFRIEDNRWVDSWSRNVNNDSSWCSPYYSRMIFCNPAYAFSNSQFFPSGFWGFGVLGFYVL